MLSEQESNVEKASAIEEYGLVHVFDFEAAMARFYC